MEAYGHILDLRPRSKRKRKDSQATTAATSAGRKPRGRPMKAATELKSRISKKSRPAPSDLSPSPKVRSWLEKLPPELIEEVFLHALEISMAKASPFLGRILSSESIFRILILFAFFRNEEYHPVETKHFEPAAYRVLGFEERLHLQQGILECHWCTLPRVQQCLPILMRLGMVGTGHRQCSNEKNEPSACTVLWRKQQEQRGGSSPQSPQSSSLPALVDANATYPYYCTLDDSCIASRKFCATLNVDYLPSRLVNPESWHATTTRTTTTTTANSSPLEFLTLLFHSYLNKAEPIIPPRDSVISSSALFDGMEKAIQERHRQAITLLHRIHREIYVSNQCSTRGEQHHTGIPSRVFHLATRQGEDSSWILEELTLGLRLDGQEVTVREIPRDDKVLTKWALRHAKGVDQAKARFAKWLLKSMENCYQ